jgi:hypothetical protein
LHWKQKKKYNITTFVNAAQDDKATHNNGSTPSSADEHANKILVSDKYSLQ